MNKHGEGEPDMISAVRL
jgi:hypothetical protein